MRSLAAQAEVEIAVQVNGKLRDRLSLPVDAAEEAARDRALASDRVAQHIEGKRSCASSTSRTGC